jgi:small subunit ribosomal protein S17
VTTETPTQSRAANRHRRLVRTGTSDKMDKTVTVEGIRLKLESKYKKYVRVHRSFKAHDEDNQYKKGDRVEIIEHRPLSRTKRWKVVRLVKRPDQELS